jgi:hypothetical protein
LGTSHWVGSTARTRVKPEKLPSLCIGARREITVRQRRHLWASNLFMVYLMTLSGCIATGYGLDGLGVGVRVPVGSRIFSPASRPALGPIQPPNQWVARALSPGVKWQGREDEHSPPTSAKVKKMWIYTSTPHTPSLRSA